MDTIYFRYTDTSSVVQTQIFNASRVRGFDDPDKVRFVPPILNILIDGRKETAFVGFQRIITVELAALDSLEDFIRAFLQAETKSIIYQGSSMSMDESIVISEATELENEWLNEFQHTKRYVIELLDFTVYKKWPFYPSDNMIGFIIKNVQITGTQASPESFTTNVGKLLYNYGAIPFPTILLTDYNVSVMPSPRQDGKFNQVDDVTQSGNNITFKLAVSDAGNPLAADGLFYADIVILCQDIT